VRSPFLAAGVALALVSALLAAKSGAAVDASPQAVVRAGNFLVYDTSRRLLVLDARGKVVRRLPRSLSPSALQAIELAGDRRHAFISTRRSEQPARLYELDLTTGRRRSLANAISPTLNPDRKRLAYVLTNVRNEIVYRTSLVIRQLATGRELALALGPRVPLGTPPELVINWSPDGRRIAIFDGSMVRIVDVATARDVPSQPAVPGNTGLAPVFLDANTLVVLADCCIGRQHLVAVELRSGARTAFAGLSSPAESIRRLKQRRLLTVTALNELAVVSRGRTRVLAKRVITAAG
jgi:Tol biopolymer transport system component